MLIWISNTYINLVWIQQISVHYSQPLLILLQTRARQRTKNVQRNIQPPQRLLIYLCWSWIWTSKYIKSISTAYLWKNRMDILAEWYEVWNQWCYHVISELDLLVCNYHTAWDYLVTLCKIHVQCIYKKFWEWASEWFKISFIL